MNQSLGDLKQYIGRKTEPVRDVVIASSMEKLAATVGTEDVRWERGRPIPEGWYIALIPPVHRPSNMREDGLPLIATLPVSIPLPRRRMGPVRATFHEPLRIGDDVEAISEISDIKVEDGPEGTRVTLVDRVSIICPRGLAVVEETERLWLSDQAAARKSTASANPKREPAWTQVIEPTPVMLFRASAAKFNSHRIHYDRDYATKIEGLPGLAVQSTLLALFLIEMCRRGLPDASLKTFTHRRVRQLYDTSGPLKLAGQPEGSRVHCWVEAPEGDIAMLAEATVERN